MDTSNIDSRIPIQNEVTPQQKLDNDVVFKQCANLRNEVMKEMQVGSSKKSSPEAEKANRDVEFVMSPKESAALANIYGAQALDKAFTSTKDTNSS